MTYLTSGIILQSTPFREYDKLVSIYTHEYGKIVALARGTLKIKSKLCGHIEPLVHSSFMIAKGRTFDIVAQSSAEQVFPGIRRNFLKTITANIALEAVNACTQEGLEDGMIFDHLRAFLAVLEHTDFIENGLALETASAFLFRLLKLLGHGPEIQKCAQCKCAAEDHLLSAFDFAHSWLWCHRCYDGTVEGAVILNKHDVQILQNWTAHDFISETPLKNGCSATVLDVARTSYRYLLDGRELNSLVFLQRYCTI